MARKKYTAEQIIGGKVIYITSKLMRHANINITAKVYTHETIEDKRQAIEKAFS